MHTVKRAIIMAAGKGERLKPLTLTTPKPLIKVSGVPMIETVIDSLLKNDINEIYIVVGYMKEKFDYLSEKYSCVHLIDNPYYDSCNNISSLYVAREHLKDVIILDGDQIIYNSSILTKEFKKSSYNCVWTDVHTDEWLMVLEGDKVTSCSRTGGERGWQLYSVSRWSAEDGEKLKNHIEIEFETNKNHNIYWDDIALFCYPDEYDLGIMKIKKEDIIEIDNLEELILIDSGYSNVIQKKG